MRFQEDQINLLLGLVQKKNDSSLSKMLQKFKSKSAEIGCRKSLFVLSFLYVQKYMRKARRIPFRRQTNKAAAPASSQLSSQSSHGQTPLSSVNSLVLCSEDVNLSGALASVTSVSMQTKEQQFSPCKFLFLAANIK